MTSICVNNSSSDFVRTARSARFGLNARSSAFAPRLTFSTRAHNAMPLRSNRATRGFCLNLLRTSTSRSRLTLNKLLDCACAILREIDFLLFFKKFADRFKAFTFVETCLRSGVNALTQRVSPVPPLLNDCAGASSNSRAATTKKRATVLQSSGLERGSYHFSPSTCCKRLSSCESLLFKGNSISCLRAANIIIPSAGFAPSRIIRLQTLQWVVYLYSGFAACVGT